MVAFNRYTHSVSNKTDQSYERYRAFEKFAGSFVQKKKTNNAYFNKWLGEKIDTDLK
ncbi:hypothetical protein D3C87_2028540 [compost metagenome]